VTGKDSKQKKRSRPRSKKTYTKKGVKMTFLKKISLEQGKRTLRVAGHAKRKEGKTVPRMGKTGRAENSKVRRNVSKKRQAGWRKEGRGHKEK